MAGQTIYERKNNTILKNHDCFIKNVIISDLYQTSVYSQ